MTYVEEKSMSHSLILGAILLNIISSQSNVTAATDNTTHTVIAHTRDVTVFENQYRKEQAEARKVGYSKPGFCKIALEINAPNPVVYVSGNYVPIKKYCRDFIAAQAKAAQTPVTPPPDAQDKDSYAISTTNAKGASAYIKYNKPRELSKKEWFKPQEFCAQTTQQDCNQKVAMTQRGIVAPTDIRKTISAYCAEFAKTKCPAK